MNLTRWRAMRFVSWLLPLLAYLVMVLCAMPSHKLADGERAFVNDEAYRSFVMGRTLAEAHVYGASRAETVPMLQDTLWHGLIGLVSLGLRDQVAAATLLGIAFGAITVLLLIRLCRLVFPYPFFGFFAAGLMVLMPNLASASLSGTSATLAMCLVLAAIVAHLESVAISGRGLPRIAALWIGLAMWLRLEFVAIWLLLWIHAILTACLPAQKKPHCGTAIFSGVNGLLLLALLLLPLFLWNQLQSIQVPWPRLPGVPMAINDWRDLGAAEAWSATLAWVGVGVEEARAAFRAGARPQGMWAGLFFMVGWLLLLIQVVRSAEDRPFSFFLLTPFLPLLLGLFYPYTGGDAFAMLAVTFRPVMILIVAYGVVRFPFVLQPLLGKKVPLITTDLAFNCWWGVTGGIMVLAALVGQVRDLRGVRAELVQANEQRQMISSAIDEYGLIRDRFATDQPGWLVWEHRVRFMDFQTRWTPGLLALLAGQSELEADAVWRYIRSLDEPRQPTVWVFHDQQTLAFRDGIKQQEVILHPDELTHPDLPWMILDVSHDGL